MSLRRAASTVLVGALVAAMLPLLAPVVSAGAISLPFSCGGPEVVGQEGTVTGIVPGTLILRKGTWEVDDATIGGAVVIRPGATVTIENSTIAGAISVGKGASLILCNSTVGGSLNAVNAPSGVTVCTTTLGGSINVLHSTGLVLIGDPFGAFCGSNQLTSVGSNNLVDNTGGVDVTNNVITGTIDFYNNSGGSPEGPSVAVQGNTVGGSLSCAGNTPPPSDYGTPNVVTGPQTGQCASFGPPGGTA